MLTVTKNGVTEAISKFNNYERIQEVNGAFTLSFTSFFHPKNHGHVLLENETILDEDGYSFRIKQCKRNATSKQIVATSTYFDNAGKRKYGVYGGSHTLDEFLSWTLAGTGWTFTNTDVTDTVLIPNFGDDNVVKLIEILRVAFDCQMEIAPNNTLVFAKQIGPDNDAQYRYGYNIIEISEQTDTTQLATVIKGFGADGLEVTYTSPNANVFGNIEAEPIYDDRFTSSDTLTEHIKRELVDYPETSIELNAVELEGKSLGERVWLIHERLGVEFQTQVLAIKKRIPAVLSTVVLGNRLPRTTTDVLISQRVEIDRNKTETRSRFDQTNDRITLEVERIDDSIATIEIEADNIQLSVSSLDTRLGSAESSISVQASQITQKVGYTDYNGNEIASRLNQTATTITLDAQMIELLGITNVANTLWLGNVGDDSSFKSINFRNNSSIYTPPNVLSLVLESFGYIFLGSDVKFQKYTGGSVNVDFSGANVTGLTVSNADYATNAGNADTLDYYHASDFSLSGHTHSNNEYVKPQVAQSIQLRVDNSLNRLYVYNGSNSYYIPMT